MSADNFITINRKTFEVKEICMSDGRTIKKLGKAKNLEGAADIACEETKLGRIEDGIEFIDK